MGLDAILETVAQPAIHWSVFAILGAISLLLYFGKRRIERSAEDKSLDLLQKQTALVKERLKLADDHSPEIVEAALRAAQVDPEQIILQINEFQRLASTAGLETSTEQLASSVEQLIESYVALIRIVCIHSGSEADLIQKFDFLVQPFVDAFGLNDAWDDPEQWGKRRALAQATFWSTFDTLKQQGSGFGHWERLVEQFAAEIPRPKNQESAT